MKNIKLGSLLISLFFAPALLLCAQTPAPKTEKPAAKKEAVKPAKPRQSPAEKPVPPPDPFEESLKKIKSTDATERRQAADFIGQSRNGKGAPALMSALSDDSPRVRQAAADALGMLTWREASPRLAELLLKDDDASVRQQAAISLSYLMDAASGPALVNALKDSSPAVRYAALHTLAVIKYAPAEAEITNLLSSDDANMRRGAISALGELQAKKAAKAIAAAVKDPDQYVQLEAVKALGSIGDVSYSGDLVRLLDKSERPQLRVEAALTLAKMGMNDGLLTAYEFAKSPDLSLKSQALNAIAAVGDARSLQFVEELYAAEQDPANKSMLDFTRRRLILKLKSK